MTQVSHGTWIASLARRGARLATTRSASVGVGMVGGAMVVGVVAEYAIRRVLAVRLGPEAYGVVYVAIAAATIAARIAQLGVSASVKRATAIHAAEGRPERAAASVRAAAAIVACLSMVLAAGAAWAAGPIASLLLGSAARAPIVFAAAALLPCLALVEVAQGALFGLRRTGAAVLASPVVEKGVTLLLLLPAWVLLSSAEGALVAIFVGALASLGCGLVVLRRGAAALTLPGASAWSEGRALLAFGWRVQVATIGMLLLGRLDCALIGLFVGEREVGLYHAALPLAELVQIGLVAASTAILPSFAEPFARGDVNVLRARYVRSQLWVFVAAAPVAAALLAAPAGVASFVYSPAFAPASEALAPLAVSVVLLAAAGPYAAVLVAAGRTRALVLATFGAVVAMCVADLVLVPRLGILGAGLGRIAAAVAGGAIAIVALRREFGGRWLHERTIRVALVIALAALAGAGAASFPLHAALAGTLSALGCLVLLLALGAIPGAEVAWARGRVRSLVS